MENFDIDNPVMEASSPVASPKKGKAVKAKASKPSSGKPSDVMITPPNFQEATIRIRGTAPLVMHAFSAKQQQVMEETQKRGSQAKKERKKAPKDFSALFERARHRAREGWDGIPAAAFRLAMIAACRTVGFAMTVSKMSIFIVADGYDRESGQPLVKITKGKPHEHRAPARNATGVIDIRARPMWDEWEAVVHLRWDADQFSASDAVNLLARAGAQVGILEGRPFSTNSAGCGWGTFEVVS